MKYHPFAYWLLALGIGIWVQYKFEPEISWVVVGLVFSISLHTIFTFAKLTKGFIFFSGFLFIIGIGALRFLQYNAEAFPTIQLSQDKEVYYVQIKEQLKPSEKYNKYYAKLLGTGKANDSLFAGQKLLLYLKEQPHRLHTDDRFWIYGKLDTLSGPKNPHAFNYKAYMKLKRIRLQIFSDSLASLEHAQPGSLNHELSVFKQNIKNQLAEKGFSNNSKIFISSLALGDRSDLDRDFQEKLSSAGVMHLFAISGLHVGIIFGFLMIILYPVLFLPSGKIIRWLIALGMIWVFAWFVGFTPSVTRAVFMISFYYLTLVIQRNTNIYHTLAFTAFVLLLIQPNQLFEVGFQLSYSAVFFIAWLFQPVRKLLPRYRKPYKNYFFNLMSVTTVAQLGVLPISVFYFNKFSGLFLIGNLVILPFATTMVILSFITVILLGLNVFPLFMVEIFNQAFQKVYVFLDYLTSYESVIFRNLTWDWLQVVLLIVLMLTLRPIILSFRWKKLIPLFSILLLFQGTRIYSDYKTNLAKEFIVFHQYKGSIIGVRAGDSMDVFWQVEDSANARNFTINPYVLKEKISDLQLYDLMASQEKEFYIKNKNLIKVNGLTYYITDNHLSQFPATDKVILTQSPYTIPEEIPAKIKRIIADGSNYPSQINKLKKISDKVYSTHENGAYLETIQ